MINRERQQRALGFEWYVRAEPLPANLLPAGQCLPVVHDLRLAVSHNRRIDLIATLMSGWRIFQKQPRRRRRPSWRDMSGNHSSRELFVGKERLGNALDSFISAQKCAETNSQSCSLRPELVPAPYSK